MAAEQRVPRVSSNVLCSMLVGSVAALRYYDEPNRRAGGGLDRDLHGRVAVRQALWLRHQPAIRRIQLRRRMVRL